MSEVIAGRLLIEARPPMGTGVARRLHLTRPALLVSLLLEAGLLLWLWLWLSVGIAPTAAAETSWAAVSPATESTESAATKASESTTELATWALKEVEAIVAAKTWLRLWLKLRLWITEGHKLCTTLGPHEATIGRGSDRGWLAIYELLCRGRSATATLEAEAAERRSLRHGIATEAAGLGRGLSVAGASVGVRVGHRVAHIEATDLLGVRVGPAVGAGLGATSLRIDRGLTQLVVVLHIVVQVEAEQTQAQTQITVGAALQSEALAQIVRGERGAEAHVAHTELIRNAAADGTVGIGARACQGVADLQASQIHVTCACLAVGDDALSILAGHCTRVRQTLCVLQVVAQIHLALVGVRVGFRHGSLALATSEARLGSEAALGSKARLLPEAQELCLSYREREEERENSSVCERERESGLVGQKVNEKVFAQLAKLCCLLRDIKGKHITELYAFIIHTPIPPSPIPSFPHSSCSCLVELLKLVLFSKIFFVCFFPHFAVSNLNIIKCASLSSSSSLHYCYILCFVCCLFSPKLFRDFTQKTLPNNVDN